MRATGPQAAHGHQLQLPVGGAWEAVASTDGWALRCIYCATEHVDGPCALPADQEDSRPHLCLPGSCDLGDALRT
jgi:hypothetical protein